LLSPAFAIGLYWVSYSYSGWNAAAYIAGELDNPQKNLPKSLFRGTLVVTALYVFLNFIFLYTTPIAEMAGQKEVGYISAGYIFGEVGGKVIGGIIAILLVSSVSSMVLVGPRVAMVMGEDLGLLRIFSLKNKNGIPWLAVLFQSLISLVLIFTSTFESVLMYIGFTINIFTFLTVSGLFVLRIMKPELPRPYKTWGYPLPPIIFILVTGWILYKGFELKPEESTTGLLTVTAGIVIYLIDRIFTAQKK
jgi:basic amino acid/polyamine antiporter, APA family